MKKHAGLLFVLCLLLTFGAAKAQTQPSGFYQYYSGEDDSSIHNFSFGDDPNTCPSYYLNAYEDVYIEADNGNGGNSYYFSLVSGNPDSYFNYGGYGMLNMGPGEYAILKADFSTPSGTVSKYVYFETF